MVGPGHLDHQVVAGVGAQTGDPMELGHIEVEAHIPELEDRPGGQPVTTRLVSGILPLLHKGHVVPVTSQPVGSSRTCGAAADNED